jgi:hypothetical protein
MRPIVRPGAVLVDDLERRRVASPSKGDLEQVQGCVRVEVDDLGNRVSKTIITSIA